MELSSSDIKKIHIFLKERNYYIMSYISVLITQHFFSSSSKNKNIHPKKLSYASGKGSTKQTSSIFSKESFSYISVNESSKTETIKKLLNL